MLAVLLIITLCFFFLFGLIIGRGSVPPSAPAALERFIAPSSSPEGEGPEHILPEEDLRFMTNLRSGSATSPGSATPGAAQRPAAPATPTTPPASQTPAQQPAITQPPISQPTAPATPPATSTASDDAKFDFVLRVAAFKNEAPADALRLRLEEAGIRTRLIREKSQNTTWYHVQVLYRGTAQNFQTIRDSMPSFGLKDSILASKTPVP